MKIVKNLNLNILAAVMAGCAFLLVIGNLMIINALAPQYGDKALIYLAAGVIIGAFVYFCSPQRILPAAPYLTGILVFSLLLCPVTNFSFNGVCRWLRVGNFSITPALFAVPILCLFWIWIINRTHNGENRKILMLPGAVILLVVGLLLTESYFSMAGVIIVFSGILLPLSVTKGKRVLAICSAIAITLLILAFFTINSNIQTSLQEFYSTLFTPSPQGNYHTWSLLTTLRNSVFFGHRDVTQAPIYHIPNAVNDSALIAGCGEFGFSFLIAALALFLCILAGGIVIFLRCTAPGDRLTVAGMTGALGLPFAVNILMMFGLLPIGSMGFPFLAYNGSAMAANAFALGMIIATAKQISSADENIRFSFSRKKILITFPMLFITVLSVIMYRQSNQEHIDFQARLRKDEAQYNTEFNISEKIFLKFPGRSPIKHYTVPEGIKIIGYRAFDLCRNLEKIVLPASLEEIESWGFYYNPRLKEINIPERVRKIGEMAFASCPELRSIRIPAGIAEIKSLTFMHCSSLQQVHIPASVTKIGSCAFQGCMNLKLEDIPPQITHIGDMAFQWCSEIKKVTIGKNITYLGENAFPKTTKITIGPGQKIFVFDQYGVLYNNRDKILLSAPAGLRGTYNVPEGTLKIAASAFESCRNLSEIRLPESVRQIGTWAFKDCTALSTIKLPSHIEEMGAAVFENCSNLTAVKLPSGMREISSSFFADCICLQKINIPETVTVIGSGAFKNCSSLTVLTLPENLKLIQYGSFRNCSRLQKINIPPAITHIGSHTFADCTDLREITLSDTIIEIGPWAFSNCKNLKYIHGGKKLQKVAEGAFENCHSLGALRIP